MPRFYINPEFWDPNNLILCEAESHHCLNVLRLKEGDKITAFNGQGGEVHHLDLAAVAQLREAEVHRGRQPQGHAPPCH